MAQPKEDQLSPDARFVLRKRQTMTWVTGQFILARDGTTDRYLPARDPDIEGLCDVLDGGRGDNAPNLSARIAEFLEQRGRHADARIFGIFTLLLGGAQVEKVIERLLYECTGDVFSVLYARNAKLMGATYADVLDLFLRGYDSEAIKKLLASGMNPGLATSISTLMSGVPSKFAEMTLRYLKKKNTNEAKFLKALSGNSVKYMTVPEESSWRIQLALCIRGWANVDKDRICGGVAKYLRLLEKISPGDVAVKGVPKASCEPVALCADIVPFIAYYMIRENSRDLADIPVLLFARRYSSPVLPFLIGIVLDRALPGSVHLKERIHILGRTILEQHIHTGLKLSKAVVLLSYVEPELRQNFFYSNVRLIERDILTPREYQAAFDTALGLMSLGNGNIYDAKRYLQRCESPLAVIPLLADAETRTLLQDGSYDKVLEQIKLQENETQSQLAYLHQVLSLLCGNDGDVAAAEWLRRTPLLQPSLRERLADDALAIIFQREPMNACACTPSSVKPSSMAFRALGCGLARHML